MRPTHSILEEYRRRRFEIFETWSNSDITFRELAKQYQIKTAYARELVWKVILHEGGQSERARAAVAKMEKLWKGADLLRRYEVGSLGRARNKPKSRRARHSSTAR